MLINEKEVNGRLFVQDLLSPEFLRYALFIPENYDKDIDFTDICLSWDEYEMLRENIFDIKMRDKIQNNLIKLAMIDSYKSCQYEGKIGV